MILIRYASLLGKSISFIHLGYIFEHVPRFLFIDDDIFHVLFNQLSVNLESTLLKLLS